MAIGFSVGDIFAGIEFVRSTIDALSGSTGSKAQYEGVIGTLTSFEAALSQLATFEADAAEKQFIQDIVDRITATISRCAEKICKYELQLGAASAAKPWRSVLRKVQWQQYTKNDVKSFHAELLLHASALHLGLARIQNASIGRQRGSIDDVCSRL